MTRTERVRCLTAAVQCLEAAGSRLALQVQEEIAELIERDTLQDEPRWEPGPRIPAVKTTFEVQHG